MTKQEYIDWLEKEVQAFKTALHSEIERHLATMADAATGRAVARKLRDLAALLAAEVDRWGYGDFHYGETPRDPGVLAALTAYSDTMATEDAYLASLDSEPDRG
jgi:hypothetical protein